MRTTAAASLTTWLLPSCVGANPVAAFRSRAGITLRDLSDRTGVAASYLSEIERGLKPGSAATLSRIANALGTTIDSLVME